MFMSLELGMGYKDDTKMLGALEARRVSMKDELDQAKPLLKK